MTEILPVRVEPLETRIAPAFAAAIDLSSLMGSDGFVLTGTVYWENVGVSVSSAGDINNDGFDDIIVGAYGASPNGRESGASYVVFGKAGGFGARLDLSSLDGRNGFKLSGVAVDDRSGISVSAAGDVNGDGFGDLIIGADLADVNGEWSGASYVVFGKASGFAANLNLSTLNGTNGFRLVGVAGDQAGQSVSAAGDVNGDGFDDVIIGAPGADSHGINSGASYVVFGRPDGFAASLNLASLDGRNGFKLSGVAERDRAGNSVSGVGDINGDGFDDIIVGADYANDLFSSRSGAGYVVFGKGTDFAPNIDLSSLNGSNGFKLRGVGSDDRTGHSVSAAGDINGDGFGDLIIGAYYAGDSGAGYVVFGKKSGFAASLDLSSLNGSNGFRISGAAAGDRAGTSVSGAGDVNGDGFDDLIIGAEGADPHDSWSGASFVVFGKKTGFGPNLNLASLNGTNGFRLNGTASMDRSGGAVSAAGDVNGDGFDDVIIGAFLADPVQEASGASYVIFGGPTATISLSGASVVEGNAGGTDLTFTASLSAASTVPVSVHYTVQGGTALEGSDFTRDAGELLTFGPGETSKTITIHVAGDVTYENDETLNVVLSAAVNASIANGSATGTIRNDDTPPAVSISGGSLVEGNSGTSSLVFTVSLSAASGLPTSVNFASADGTAASGSDYKALTPGTLNFAPGETEKTISVAVLGNTRIEDLKEFSVLLSGVAGATIGTGTATGTILNDDTALRITGPGTLMEGNAGTSTALFHVSLEKPSALPVSVSFSTADGSALSGSDFVALSGTLTFAPGETEKTITVELMGDTLVEAHESFSVFLSAPANATIVPAEGSASATILNDDTALSISDAQVLEGHSGSRTLSFTVSLAAASALPVSVSFASADDSATAGSDYTPLIPGTLSFAPGETEKTLSIEVRGDTDAEISESFSIVLSSPDNALIVKGTATGTILNDDVTLSGKRKATFRDMDGDLVTITINKGTLKVEDFTLFPSGNGSQLALIDFAGQSEFQGANLSVTAKKSKGSTNGDGWVNVGFIDAAGVNLGKVTIKGDVGQIDAGSGIGSKPAVLSLSAASLGAKGLVTQLPGSGSLTSEILGSLKSISLSENLQDAALSVSGDIGRIDIRGSLLAGSIRSDGRIGAVKIGGAVEGSSQAGDEAVISARGGLAPSSESKALAIASLSVKGSVSHAKILAGYDRTGAGINADVRIGAVSVKGDWSESSLVAGAEAGADSFFGTEDDVLIPSGNSVVARIASILIKGSVSGSVATADDSFGFVAEEIGSFSAGGTKFSLIKGKSNDSAGLSIGSTADVRVKEVE